ncbi:type II toxin-antitoxin system VapC family toxin [Kibdelosporangium aridum]|uniref:Predicted nucleic acid-binding protein, contains PIN domain n=1 Tax=Kibdelosporangium aridum TaxID=2030 RepID=A0A1W2F2G0_KIBAR|nr:type II toxin-antitoxin system VapC family toxin [Kibdelosporangium aridum]SMD16135.1 Predicted nucleic acid-binding protein, contains PIN domain [Kibdelosporangium aridum]
MSVFADSSALVKRYAKEEGQNLVRQIPVLVISHLARVEVPSAFWRKQRMGQLSNREAAVLVSLFENDYYDTEDKAPFVVLGVTPVVLEAAARLTRRHELRAFDAIQLASAKLAAEGDPEITEFAVWDKRLREAAAAEGFTLIPA